MSLEEYLKNKNGQNKKRNIKGITLKLVILIFVVFAILSIVKLSPETKDMIKKDLFETNLDFSKFNSIVSKLFPEENTPVDSNGIKYKNYTPYLNGVALEMIEDEGVNLIDSGIVVFVGEKDNYGKTIIVQQSNGVNVWYGNLDNISVNLYDYITKNSIIASSKDKLYLVFEKNGEYLDYKNFI